MSGTVEAGRERVPAGATGFLTKPFRLEQLLTVIAQSMGANPAASDRTSSPADSEPSAPG